MRREWSGWIKARQWNEFEQLAKTEPNQTLADTVAELERGFPDKADRRALRKVLYLLSQAGYTPTPLDEAEPAAAPTAPFEFALLVSADAGGDAVITYGTQRGARVRWLTAHLNGGRGITRAGEEEHSLEDSRARAERLKASNPHPFRCAEIAPADALWRVREAFERTRGVRPPVLAYWRSLLDAAEPRPHPAETLPRETADDETLQRVPVSSDDTVMWRLELGAAATMLPDLVANQTDETKSDEERREATDAIVREARARAFTPEVIADHERRLLDLAYLRHLQDAEGVGLLLAARDDLLANGPESAYAKGLMDKTLVLLVETMRQRKNARPATT